MIKKLFAWKKPSQPDDELAPFVRTDFSNNVDWRTLVNLVETKNEMGFKACINVISDPRFANANPADIVRAFPKQLVVFIIDQHALKKHEILCVDAEDDRLTLRAKAKDLWIVENNVSLGNLLFEELLEQTDENGVLVEY